MSASSIRCLVAAALSVANMGAAAQGFDTPPTAGAPRPLSIAPPTEQRLANGLRVVLAERRGVQLVTAKLLVLSGAEADPGARAGLASMTANLLTKGTRRHSATQLAQAAESLGGALDSGAGWHQSEVGITVAVPQADAALALVAEVVTEPAFAQTELDRSRTQALDGLKVAYSQPGTLAGLAAQRLLYGDGPYAHPSSGTPGSLTTLTRADLVALHAARYRPDNAVLVLAGDLDTATALQLATRHFGSWKPAESAAPSVAVEGQPAKAASPIAIEMPSSGQAAVVVMAALPAAGADRATAIVTNAVLGGGFSSRLNQEIRIRRGLSYGAGSGIDLRPGGGALRATVQTKNESADAGPGRIRPARRLTRARRRARCAQGQSGRRVQPQRRDHGRPRSGSAIADRRRPARCQPRHPHRCPARRGPGRRAALCRSLPRPGGPARGGGGG
jgi:zinc protease